MHKTIIVFVSVLTISLAYHLGDSHHEEHETKKDYNFDYTVHDPHTHDYHSHQESSKDGVVKGYYSVKDADGSLREVHYTADPKTGFKAVVTKNGVQVHPHTQESSEHHETVSEHHHIPEHHEEHYIPEHHEGVEHHFPEHHETEEHHEPIHHEALEHHEPLEHHHISEHHEHPFAVGLSSLHDIQENHFQHHLLQPEHLHHF